MCVWGGGGLSTLSSFVIILMRMITLILFYLSCTCLCNVSLHHGAEARPVVCDRGIFRSRSLLDFSLQFLPD